MIFTSPFILQYYFYYISELRIPTYKYDMKLFRIPQAGQAPVLERSSARNYLKNLVLPVIVFNQFPTITAKAEHF